MKLALELASDQVAAGDEVTGHVQVLEGGPARSLTLTLSFHEWTRDFAAVRYSSGGVVHEGDLVTGEPIAFNFTVPAEAPPSIKAEHSELYWELDVQSDRPGRDANASLRVEIQAGTR